MNKNTTNEKTVSPVIDRIKIAIDMHLKNDCFVRQQDYSAPEPPQKLSPEAFLAWLAKQRKLAREVVLGDPRAGGSRRSERGCRLQFLERWPHEGHSSFERRCRFAGEL
jgi:hypothetical protein